MADYLPYSAIVAAVQALANTGGSFQYFNGKTFKSVNDPGFPANQAQVDADYAAVLGTAGAAQTTIAGLTSSLLGKNTRSNIYNARSPWLRRPACLTPPKVYCQGLSTAADTGTSAWGMVAPYAMHSIEAVWGNWIVAGGTGEVITGGNQITIGAATLEYPLGSFTPLTWLGRTSVSTDLWGNIKCDPADINIPAGALFRIRTYVSAGSKFPRGTACMGALNAGNGVNYQSQVTGAGNDQTQTVGNAWISSGGTFGFTPWLVLAIPDAGYGECTVIVGDSIGYGQGDNSAWYSWLDRGLDAAKVPHHNVSNPSDSMNLLATSPAAWRNRLLAIEGSTKAIVQLGTNDLFALSRTFSQLQADTKTVINMMLARGLQVFLCTILPRTTSSDTWATATNQAVQAGEAFRVAYNEWVRTVPTGVTGIIDPCTVMEVNNANAITRNGGLTYSTGVASAITVDGTHPATNGHITASQSVTPVATALMLAA